MALSWKIVIGIIAFTLLLRVAQSEIHRAKALRGKASTKAGSRGHVISPDSELGGEPVSPRLAEQGVKRGHSRETWLYSMGSAVLVGLSGIFPLLVIPLEAGKALRKGAAAARLKLLLSFAVGGLLGDVFLHLLPEAWKHVDHDAHDGHMSIGLWVLAGLFTFLAVEKIFPDNKDGEDEEENRQEHVKSEVNHRKTTATPNGVIHHRTGNKKKKAQNAANGVAQNGKAHINENASQTQNGVIQNGTAHHGKQHTRPSANGKQNTRPADNGKQHTRPADSSKQHTRPSANGKQHTRPADSGKQHTRPADNSKQHTRPSANGKQLTRSADNGKQHTRPANNGKHSNVQGDGTLSHIKTSGWLNLMANVIDNFTHGLAVAGSYCVGTKSGILTTIIILIHEVPHEVGDFAILLRSGFDRWAAAKAQMLTATGGLLGAFVALAAESAVSAGDAVAWILPFTSGGFIYIALVTVVPDLLKETDSWESLKQALMLVLGVFSMAAVALYLDEHSSTSLDWFVS